MSNYIRIDNLIAGKRNQMHQAASVKYYVYMYDSHHSDKIGTEVYSFEFGMECPDDCMLVETVISHHRFNELYKLYWYLVDRYPAFKEYVTTRGIIFPSRWSWKFWPGVLEARKNAIRDIFARVNQCEDVINDPEFNRMFIAGN